MSTSTYRKGHKRRETTGNKGKSKKRDRMDAEESPPPPSHRTLSTRSRRGDKMKPSSSRTRVNNTSFRVSIPLSSATTSNSQAVTSSIPTTTLPSDHTYSIPVTAQSTDAHSSAAQNSTIPPSASLTATTSAGNPIQLTPFNRNPAFLTTHFSGPHSPIAMLAPHASHTLPLTSLGSTSTSDSNDISIRDASSLPYYYPPEWNADDFNVSFSPSSVGMVHPMDTTTTASAGQSSHVNDSSFESYSNQTFTSNGADILNNGFIHELSPQHFLRSSSVEPSTDDDDDNDNGARRMHFYPRESASDRTSQQMGGSESHRRRGVSYTANEHQHMLRTLLQSETPPQTLSSPVSSSGYNFRRRASEMIGLASHSEVSRLQHSLNAISQIAARRVGWARPGRSGLDMVYTRPLNGDSSDSSTNRTDELLEPSSPSILAGSDEFTPRSDYSGQSGSEPPHYDGDGTPELLSASGRVGQATTSTEDTDVITISSDDEEPEVVHVERRQRPTRSHHHRRHHRDATATTDGVGPSGSDQVESDEEYARRLQYFIPNDHMASRYMRDNHGSLSDGIQQWTPAGARRFIVRALSHRRRGQRGSRPASRTAMMSHIAQLPPALLLDSLIGSSSREMGYEQLLELADRLGPAKAQGMKKEEIERLRTRVYKGKTSSDSSNCVICMNDYEAGDKLRELLCAHEYHTHCIDQWLKENQTCPICRLDTKLTCDS
ncbi:uncharacterized protein [Dysidea avara]|uniref:uncharacterized protein isoform X2 n=1 Tax=Dysidea avara TaxID=196820 RepID=UPI0033214AA1